MLKQAGILFFTLLFSVGLLPAQDAAKIQQYTSKLRKAGADTTRINLCMEIAKEYRNNNKDSALKYINKAVKLAREKNLVALSANALYVKATVYYFVSDFKNARNIQLQSVAQAKTVNDLELLSRNYNLLGAIEFNYGNYDEARKYYDLKLSISTQLKDTSSIIESYYNIALIYNQRGDIKTAISWEYKSLRLAEVFRDSSEILYCAQGLAETYHKISDVKNARFYLEKAKKIASALNDKYSMVGLLIDEGNIYQLLAEWEPSIKCYDEAIALAIISGDRYHESIAINNKAISRRKQKKYSDAILLFGQSEKISQSLGNKHGLVQTYLGMAQTYFDMKEYERSFPYAQKVKILATELKTTEDMLNTSEILAKLFEQKQQPDSALFYFKLNAMLKDSLQSAVRLKAVAEEGHSYEKDKIQQVREVEKKLADERLQKQQQIRNIFIVSSIIILAALVLLFRNFRQKQKANHEITEQKKIIEHKNKDILDSINYSKRIQDAILTPEDEVKKLLPRSFVLFMPKDIVSGDFYFIEPVEGRDGSRLIALAMADCTGHGVPGAFMSIMAYNFLKQSLKEETVNTSGKALDYVNQELISFLRLNQQAKANLRDGMDIAFCAIYPDHTLNFAGANNPLWIVSKTPQLHLENGNEVPCIGQRNGFFLFEIKATKQHVGYNEHTRPFESHTVKLQKNDMAILFTDGYADQFGGPQGKKIKSKKFAEIVLDHAHLEEEALAQALRQFFREWKNTLEQVDDVSIIGCRI